ncbi:MAG: trypsin-like peptidase domain-containing protein [Chloroflexi bacterium]|nr:trypsin-like peptidase domain-containing protein [Chloroflexota bacterium]
MGAGVLIALAGVYLYDATRPPPQRLTQRDIDVAVERSLANAPAKPSFAAQAYGVVGPSVVRVEAIVPGRGRTGTSLGSGVVVDDTGTILTALHVVRGAAGVRVLFADGTDSEALIVMAQAENDLAVLRPAVVPDDLVPATLASSATLRVGDEVVAVGSPFGIPTSVSAGVVSGLGRSHRLPGTGETLRNLIQFDAAVNPGNSGGPLVNRDGEVVGIVVALLNPTEQDVFIGIGFAVTMETAGGLAGAPPL